ncbi:MAG: hypothetical protein ACI8QQ_002521 [Psychroserpens sp.]|jgi:hypothetical protein
MDSHFCKVGKTITSNNTSFSLKYLEDKYLRFIEEAYNLEQIDMSLSDILFYEAKKLKLRILNLKHTNPKVLDVVF